MTSHQLVNVDPNTESEYEFDDQITGTRMKIYGRLLAQGTSDPFEQYPRWTELRVFKLEKGWAVIHTGCSTVAHRADGGCERLQGGPAGGIKTIAADSPEADDYELCFTCNAQEAETLRPEVDLERCYIARTPAALKTRVGKRRQDGHIQMTPLGVLVYSQALRNDPDLIITELPTEARIIR